MNNNNNTHCKKCNKKISNNKYGFCQTCFQDNRNNSKIEYWLETGDTGVSTNSTLRNCIRNYILEEQNSCCKICGIKNIWNNMPLEFVLDHIDGDASNNDKKNLRLICSNCDSQLETYKSRNKNSSRGDKQDKRTKKILKIDLKTNKIIDEYNSIADASRENNCSHVTISKCLNGKQKTAIGYNWEFK